MQVMFILVMLSVQGAPGLIPKSAAPAGCAQLAGVVFDAVLQDALPGRVAVLASVGGVEECADTAATVSRAFTSAMQRTGVSLVWRGEVSGYCTTRDLSSCEPYPHTGTAGRSAGHVSLVALRWRAVQQAVQARRLSGDDADRVRYDVPGLQRSLTLSMAGSAARAGNP